jgi:hypothetical protein
MGIDQHFLEDTPIKAHGAILQNAFLSVLTCQARIWSTPHTFVMRVGKTERNSAESALILCRARDLRGRRSSARIKVV